MRTHRTTAVLLGLLVAVPALGFAALPQGTSTKPATSKSSTPTKATAPAPAVHATKGVIKSVSDTSLVISRPTAKEKEMTFMLDSTTQKKGTLAAGATVDVRYKTENKQNIATAVTVAEKKK